MSNFAYNEGEPKKKGILEYLMRDTLVRAYREAILHPTRAETRSDFQDLAIRIAIALTDEANT